MIMTRTAHHPIDDDDYEKYVKIVNVAPNSCVLGLEKRTQPLSEYYAEYLHLDLNTIEGIREMLLTALVLDHIYRVAGSDESLKLNPVCRTSLRNISGGLKKIEDQWRFVDLTKQIASRITMTINAEWNSEV